MSALILASQSASRRAMLDAAGIPFTATFAGVDEDAAKASMAASERARSRRCAGRAEGGQGVAAPSRGAGAGMRFDRHRARRDADRQDYEPRGGTPRNCARFAGATHRLSSAAVIAQRGQPIWRHVDTAKLTMRNFSDAFLESYLDAEWPAIGGCVGGYRLEGLGAQLFAKIEGSHFTILGLPLLQLLDWLRTRGVIAT
jgi:septum formation protein